MSKVTHTPGPWLAVPFHDDGQAGWQITEMATNAQLGVADVLYRRGKYKATNHYAAEANARLIAAAPEMLGALKIAHATICQLVDEKNLSSEGMTAEEYQKHSTWVGRIQAAIAKAEGRE